MYGDEEIISQRLKNANKEQYNISNIVNIGGENYKFASRNFENYSIVLPETFETANYELAKRKYPYEDRPQIILGDTNLLISFAFEICPVATTTLSERIVACKSIIKRLHPSNVFFSYDIYECENLKIAYYDFRSQAIDGDIYNLSFFTDLPDNELFGWFNCPIELKDKWEPLVRQMIQTIKPLPQEEQE